MPQKVPCLPNALLIILHLHLLDFPLQDASGYDERLFDSARGMRERNKAMEDISYFLVGKIEHSKERAKSILPTHPCLQPSDSTAFRIALSKYIEAIRNGLVYTTRAGEKPPDPKGKQRASPAHEDPIAWWWKDIVVRKSILDECCGERFERLILALSSHAVLKNTTRRASSTLDSLPEKQSAISGTSLPQAYAARFAAAQSARLEWERSAALLIQRQADLTTIRARLADPLQASSSKYDTLETDRLVALRDSRHEDLLHGPWRGDEGRGALRLITSLAGLLDPHPSSSEAPALPRQDEGHKSPSHARSVTQIPPVAETPLPLPIAAARHPSHLHALRAPLFPADGQLKSSSNCEEHTDTAAPPHAVVERLAAIGRVNQRLQEALLSVQRVHTRLQQQAQRARERDTCRAPPKANSKADKWRVNADLWAPRAGTMPQFKPPESAASLFEQFGLESPPQAGAVEERVAHIRTALLPPFAAAPEPESDPELEPPASRLPKLSSRAPLSKAKPSINNQLGAGTTAKEKYSIVGKPVPRAGVPPGSQEGQKKIKGGDDNAKAVARRLSRRASAARTRRSTFFGRGEDAEILRIVASIQDRSDSDSGSGEGDVDFETGNGGSAPIPTQLPRTPARRQHREGGTRGTLLSTGKKSAPRQSYDIERHERAPHVPRLPSLRLSGAQEVDEPEDEGARADEVQHQDAPSELDREAESAGDEAMYEGNSMTLADILLHAGHQGNVSMQLLGEELEDEMSDWE
ncbi:hypothetical protein C8Q79DRAFT_1121778 [Trametes meyenii]|nr:hypothetical protein C8Q79DRAFT_1121778 [Trametes meyenii]